MRTVPVGPPRLRHSLREDLIDRGSSLRRGPGIRPEIRLAERRPPRRQGRREGRAREAARGGRVPPAARPGGGGTRRAGRRGREPIGPRDATRGTRRDRAGTAGENLARRRTEGTASAPGRRRRKGRLAPRAVSERSAAHRERAGVRAERRVHEALSREAAPRLRRHDRVGGQPLLPEAFDQVKEGLDWAGVEYDEVLYKSDRIPLHYEWAEKLLATGEAYVCECDAETLRKNREAMRACVHRIQDVDETIAMWKAMLAGEYGEGEAVVRLKTDMAHPNPAFRDRVLFRIAVREHPRVGTRYRVWPMLEFSWAVDDALLGVTHVLRGKDLVMEDLMETRIWEILQVERRPRFVHFGILRFKDLELSKSRYRKEIAAGRLTGIDDPRTWSLQSLRRRGIRPAALREVVLPFGLSLNDIEVPAETLYAENRRLIDKDANRYFFVPDPVAVEIAGLPPIERVKAPLHPDFPGRAVREIPVGPKVQVAREDFEKFRGKEVRLKDFCNVVLDHRARFVSMEYKDIPQIQWVTHGVNVHIVLPDGFESH